MNHDITLAMLLAIPFGFSVFMAMTSGIDVHLRGLRDKLRFFLWPFPPSKMIIIKDLDGEYRILYNNEFAEVSSEDRTFIRTIYGDQYVTDVSFSQASISRSMYSAWGPEGHYTPYSLAWRWAVASAFTIYLFYYAWVRSIFNESFSVELFMLSTVLFFLSMIWLLTNVTRMQDKTISYAWYHSVGINPPHQKIVPIPSLSSLELLEYLEKLGRKVEVVIPNEATQVIESAIRLLKEKTGSRTLASVLISKLSMASVWRESLAQTLREAFDIRKAGETAAMIRMQQPVKRISIIILLLIAFGFGFGLGFTLGNVIDIGVTPATETVGPEEPQGIPSPATPPTPPISNPNATNIPQPATPPPPPG